MKKKIAEVSLTPTQRDVMTIRQDRIVAATVYEDDVSGHVRLVMRDGRMFALPWSWFRENAPPHYPPRFLDDDFANLWLAADGTMLRIGGRPYHAHILSEASRCPAGAVPRRESGFLVYPMTSHEPSTRRQGPAEVVGACRAHLVECDDDGYCCACGYQETPAELELVEAMEQNETLRTTIAELKPQVTKVWTFPDPAPAQTVEDLGPLFRKHLEDVTRQRDMMRREINRLTQRIAELNEENTDLAERVTSADRRAVYLKSVAAVLLKGEFGVFAHLRKLPDRDRAITWLTTPHPKLEGTPLQAMLSGTAGARRVALLLVEALP